MSVQECPYCGKKDVRSLKSHLHYCPRNPVIEPVTQVDPEAEFEEQAKQSETERSERVARAARGHRDFLPLPSNRKVRFPTIAWYLRPNGALPEDAFICTSAWSASQKAGTLSKGFVEVTPSKAFLMRRADGTVVGGNVQLDLPSKPRWRRILDILEARRLPALEYEQQRLEDEKAVSVAGLSPAEQAAARIRIRVYGARVEMLSHPFDAKKLYEFFEEEVRYSRRDSDPTAGIRRMVHEEVEEAMGIDLGDGLDD